MQTHSGRYLVMALAVCVLVAPRGALAIDTPLSQNPVAMAISHGECANALDLVKRDIGSNNSQSVFIAGRMLDEGLCVKKDSVVATTFYAHAAAMGDQAAQLDYAAKIGLGEGAAQDYASAGSQCRAAGLDPQKQLSDYALGYVCTVRGVTSRLLRESLPANTFQKTAGARARLEFNPAAGQLFVRASSPITEGE
ncbi:MAG: sel1 repeat family protein, partial [Proteobacteria bacterium]|nr:sel1 repeat family protein [Pseudomonadota bacterium]